MPLKRPPDSLGRMSCEKPHSAYRVRIQCLVYENAMYVGLVEARQFIEGAFEREQDEPRLRGAARHSLQEFKRHGFRTAVFSAWQKRGQIHYHTSHRAHGDHLGGPFPLLAKPSCERVNLV